MSDPFITAFKAAHRTSTPLIEDVPLMPTERTWQLTCLLCGRRLHGPGGRAGARHEVHAITRDDLRLATRQGPVEVTVDTDTGYGDLHLESYTWTLPDGREWLGASRAVGG